MWNLGSESNPIKTEYDPCPDGWRVPTIAEFSELKKNYSSWTTDKNGQSGRWFSGQELYSSSVPQVFLPAAGSRRYDGIGDGYYRGLNGYYWSSRPFAGLSTYLCFDSNDVSMSNPVRASGNSVRCVQE
jgi:uncharacterized protein (TIGR02145 family)